MSEFDWDLIRQGKDLHRVRLAALPFAEKVQILERLRHRAIELRGGWQPLSIQGPATIANGSYLQAPSGLLSSQSGASPIPGQAITTVLQFDVVGPSSTFLLATDSAQLCGQPITNTAPETQRR